MSEYRPALHPMQVWACEAPSREEYLPILHGLHMVSSVVPFSVPYLPAGQGSQAMASPPRASLLEYRPAWHASQDFSIIVPAAGVGSRMGADRPKQYLTLGGKTILARTLDKLQQLNPARLVVAISPEDPYFDATL